MENSDLIRAKVSGLAIDPSSNSPVIFLKEMRGERVLPIWIGPAEATSIAMALQNVKASRPITHDLIKTLLDGLDAKVNKVVVNELNENTFYARLYIKRDNFIIEIDARPSDSIAIALRTEAPIYVANSVFKKGEFLSVDKEKELKYHLENLKPEDFGKYKLNE